MRKTVIKTYRGSQQGAMRAYQADAERMAQKGYTPTSQVWAPGSYGCGSFILALLLCLILIGILVFIYMLIVKPDGTLTVTYTLAPQAELEKTCPRCAERVKAAAAICRFCGHEFETGSRVDQTGFPATDPMPLRLGPEAIGRRAGAAARSSAALPRALAVVLAVGGAIFLLVTILGAIRG